MITCIVSHQLNCGPALRVVSVPYLPPEVTCEGGVLSGRSRACSEFSGCRGSIHRVGVETAAVSLAWVLATPLTTT